MPDRQAIRFLQRVLWGKIISVFVLWHLLLSRFSKAIAEGKYRQGIRRGMSAPSQERNEQTPCL